MEPEYRFAKPRRFAFDFAWPDVRVAVELHGATWAGGRHTRGSGFENDCEKRCLAAESGWVMFEITGTMLDRAPLRWVDRVAAVVRERRRLLAGEAGVV